MSSFTQFFTKLILAIEEEFGSLALKVSGAKFGVLGEVSAPLIETIAASCIHLLLGFVSGATNSTSWVHEGSVGGWELLKFFDLITISPLTRSSSDKYLFWLAFKLALSICRDKISLQVITLSLPSIPSFSIVDSIEDQLPQWPSLQKLRRLTTDVISLLRPNHTFRGDLVRWWPSITAFQTSMIPVITGRSFFRLANGIVGLGPKSALSGDQIWFLDGATAPIMLRPARRAGQFEVIGEVYMPGHLQLQKNEKTNLSKISLV
jgi:hypothetical protein